MSDTPQEYVLLVNPQDEVIGQMEKMEAHRQGVLHRAFSVFVLNDRNEVMLQQRAAHKYHSPLLWTNTCCSHQRLGETNVEAGMRRLREEMGFDTPLTDWFHFIYQTPFDNGLSEHELDHVLIGRYNGTPQLNPDEVADWAWMSIEAIQQDIAAQPERYTVWFKIIFEEFAHHWAQHPLLS